MGRVFNFFQCLLPSETQFIKSGNKRGVFLCVVVFCVNFLQVISSRTEPYFGLKEGSIFKKNI